MTDPADTNRPVPPHCPWCSTVVTAETVTCPNCGATLREEAAADIPGLTQVDPGASTVRQAPRGRGLIGWLSGDYDTAEDAVDRGSVEPPTTAVRQEMLRLEMEALRVQLEAEAAARGVPGPDTSARGAAGETDTAPAEASADEDAGDAPT